MLKRMLLTPGPTPVPPEVLLAGAEPIVHHRAPRFVEIFNECVAGLQYVFQTENDVLIFASSGTGAMESAVVNMVNPGDKVVVASVGNFGARWLKLNKTWGADVVALEYEWGTKADPADIARALADNPEATAVFCQFSETSTGVVNDIKAIGEIVAATPAVLCRRRDQRPGCHRPADRRVEGRRLRGRLAEGPDDPSRSGGRGRQRQGLEARRGVRQPPLLLRLAGRPRQGRRRSDRRSRRPCLCS